MCSRPRSDDGVRVLVDGEYVINDWTSHPATNFTGGKTLTAGEHTVVVEYYQGGGGRGHQGQLRAWVCLG